MSLNQTARMAALLLLATSCTCNFDFGITNNATVEVPGDLPPDKKIELAQSIAIEVWETGLTQLVLKKFPSVSETDLSQFGILWKVVPFQPETEKDAAVKTTVLIQCSLRHSRGVSKARKIVDFCEQQVREVMRQRGIEPPTA